MRPSVAYQCNHTEYVIHHRIEISSLCGTRRMQACEILSAGAAVDDKENGEEKQVTRSHLYRRKNPRCRIVVSIGCV